MESVLDSDLVVEAQLGNGAAVAELYRRHHRWSVGYARHLLSESAPAEDVASDAMFKVIVALETGTAPVSFRGYLAAAVRNRVIDYRRRAARSCSLEVVGEDVRAGGAAAMRLEPERDFAERFAEWDTLMTALDSLTERQRLVLWRTVVQGHKVAEVAEELEVSPNAATAIAHRARKALRKAYGAGPVTREPNASDAAVARQPRPHRRTARQSACYAIIAIRDRAVAASASRNLVS